MALTKVNRGGLNTGVSDSSNATFLTVDSSEQAVIKSEGGAVTTSVQQGLIKGWIRFDGTGTIATDDSFNYASITDNGTGNYTSTLSNAMNNIFYSPVAGAGDVNFGAKIDLEADTTNTTTAMRLRTSGDVSSTGDTDLVAIHIVGDLA